MPAFAELGIDIPLFAADVEEATGWAPEGTCSICWAERPGFEIGIGAYLSLPCPACGVEAYASADGREEPCHRCSAPVGLPADVEGAHGCWRCLRSGAWAATVDTEAGMVTPALALRGVTHGGPDGDDEWGEVPMPAAVLLDLVRTPSYATWQGEQWRFHCGGAMRYLGSWGRADFAGAARAAGTAVAPADLALAVTGIPADAYAGLAEATGGASSVGVYVFDCPTCGALGGHWDCD